MKKSFFFVFAFLFVALACVTFSACGQTGTRTMEEDGVESTAPVSDTNQDVSANYNYDYDNWYEFGKNNDVGIGGYRADNEIEIDTAEKLARFLFLVNDNWGLSGTGFKWRHLHVYITADIDMSRLKWVPLGTYDCPYTGRLHGKGHYISGLKITGENTDNAMAGFFGKVTNLIEDIAVEVYIDSECASGSRVGGIAAYSSGGDFTNCAVRGTINYLPEDDRWWGWATYYNDHVGGIVGYCENSVIRNCVNYATITRKSSRNHSTSCIGGIVGYGTSCYIYNCLNLGKIDPVGSFYAGIAGKIESLGKIEYCSEYGNYEVTENFSRIYGWNNDSVKIKNCAYGYLKDNSIIQNKVNEDSDFNKYMTGTFSCYLNGDFLGWDIGWHKEIYVPSSLLYKFNISFGWNSNGEISGNFDSESNAVVMKGIKTVYFLDSMTVEIIFGIKIKIPFINSREEETNIENYDTYTYSYVLGAKPHVGYKFIINNSDMFSLNNVSVDSNFFSIDTSTGKLVYKNKVLMRMSNEFYKQDESRERDINFTFNSLSKELRIEATNCNGKTNGETDVITRVLYYHQSLREIVDPSKYYTYAAGTLYNTKDVTTTFSNPNQNEEGKTPPYIHAEYSSVSGDHVYLILDNYTGQYKICVAAKPREYKHNIVFTDRFNTANNLNTANKNPSKKIESSHNIENYNSTNQIELYSGSGDYYSSDRDKFGFTIYVKHYSNLYKIDNDDECKIEYSNNTLTLSYNIYNILNGMGLVFDDIIYDKNFCIYVNYGYIGDNLLSLSVDDIGSATNDYLPFIIKKINIITFTEKRAKNDFKKISDICLYILNYYKNYYENYDRGSKLDLGYVVTVTEDKISNEVNITVKDEFKENNVEGYNYGNNIFSLTFTPYDGYKFDGIGGVAQARTKLDDNDNTIVSPIILKFISEKITIEMKNTKTVSAYRSKNSDGELEIVNPKKEGWYEKVYIQSIDTTVNSSKIYYSYNSNTATYEEIVSTSIEDYNNKNPQENGWYEWNGYAKTANDIWILGEKYYDANKNNISTQPYIPTATSYTDNKVPFHNMIIIAADKKLNKRCVGITCKHRDEISAPFVTLKSYYLFVVDPVAYPAALSDGFKLSFDAIYVDDVSYNSNQISAPACPVTDHYVISSVANLRWLASEVNSGRTFEGCTFVQTADLNFYGEKYIPIGNETYAFKGTYDGENYSISNIVFSDDNLNLDENGFAGLFENSDDILNLDENGFVGLFGNVENATIKNLTVKDSNFIGNRYVGAFVGKATNSTFYNLNAYNCTVTVKEFEYYDIYGTLQTGKQKTYQDSINNLKVTQTIYTKDRVGFAGVVGNADNCSFTGVSFNTGTINISVINGVGGIDNLNLGAITGSHASSNSMTNCYAEADMTSLINCIGGEIDYHMLGLDNGSVAVDVYIRNTDKNNKKESCNIVNDSAWMTLNGKQVLKFFYWVV